MLALSWIEGKQDASPWCWASSLASIVIQGSTEHDCEENEPPSFCSYLLEWYCSGWAPLSAEKNEENCASSLLYVGFCEDRFSHSVLDTLYRIQ